MPYFIYRVCRATRLEKVAACDHFDQALAQVKALHDAEDLPPENEIKIMFADNEAHAEELLSHVRRPEEGLIGEA